MTRAAKALVVVLPAAFIAIFFAWPVANVISTGLADRGWNALVDLFGSRRERGVIWFTIWQAAVSTLVTMVVALPAASLVAAMRERHRRLVRALVTVPFVLPTVVVGGAFAGLFQRFGLDSGRLRLDQTVWAILLAHLFFNYAVVVRTVGSYWAGLDSRLEEQARILGANRWRTFVEITLPRLRPAIAAAAAIVFLFSFTSFGVILILGGPRRATIETDIYRFAVTRGDLQTAASLAALQLVAVLALVGLSTALERRRPITTRHARRASNPIKRAWLWGNLAVTTLILGTPIAVLIERSLSVGDGYSLRNYGALAHRVRQLPAPAMVALQNSLVFAVVATAIAVLIGGLASLVVVHGRRAVGRVFDLGLTLPLGTSAVTIGFGILITLDNPPLDLRTSWWIIPIAHALVGVPFVVRTMVPVLRGIDESIREAAAVLGATPARVRREVDLPIGSRGLVVGAGFAFAVSIGEFGATSFLPRRPDTITAPVAMFRLLSTPGDRLRGQAMALAVVLMAVVAVAVAVIESVRGTSEGGM